MDIDNITLGDVLVCVNNTHIHITQYNIYKIEEFYKYNKEMYIMVIDDGDYLDTYPITDFITIVEMRNNTINEVLK